VKSVSKRNITDGFTNGNCAPKKKFPLKIYRRIYSVGDSGISSKYVAALGKMLTNGIRQ